MISILKIRQHVGFECQAIDRSRHTLEKLQAESLAYLGDDPEKAVDSDERLSLPFAFAGHLGIAVELLKEAAEHLKYIKDASDENARKIVAELRAACDDTYLDTEEEER